ncbi:hypothetical protein [Candidatus Thiodictyon syntrophicum]|jgi:hypothetical protein|uniref:Uncharacterized protein n=1 Tax=Candidatus Thiodictyon syntrophicum TaxID=1166950 RepID=A0A2K8UJ18_9GAMM|nr:hypothetical protein [Candidatus Thiodictyon syntrophicum]AUB85181.1 hypothetical protein THSYN_30145 [Candidatus Thiodictyon syntrophicum]
MTPKTACAGGAVTLKKRSPGGFSARAELQVHRPRRSISTGTAGTAGGDSVSERGGQLAALTATVPAEQQARDADTQHWLSRLSEHQAAVAEARTRETALTEEKKALTLEARRLRQDLRKVQFGLDDDERARSTARQG